MAAGLDALSSDTPASNTAGDMINRLTGELPVNPDIKTSLSDLIGGMQNYNPDPDNQAKWLSFASNIAKPTKFGTLGEVVSNVASGLEPIVNEENKLKQQYKLAAKQQMFNAQTQAIPAYQTAQIGLAEKVMGLKVALETNKITLAVFHKAAQELGLTPDQADEVAQKPIASSSAAPEGSVPIAPLPADKATMVASQITSLTRQRDEAAANQNFERARQLQNEIDRTQGLSQGTVIPGTAQSPIPPQISTPPGVIPPGINRPTPQTTNSFMNLNREALTGALLQGPAGLSKAIVDVNTRPSTRLGEGLYEKAGKIYGSPAQAPAGYQNIQNPDGSWSLAPVGNGLAAIANSTATVEGAKQGEKIEMVKTADGRTIPVRVGSIVGTPGSPQQVAPSPTPAQPAPGIATAPPVASPTPPPGGAVAPTGLFAHVKPPAPNNAIGQSTASEQAAKSNEIQLAEEAKANRDAASAATDLTYTINQMKAAVQSFDTGKFTNFKQGIKAGIQGIMPGAFSSDELDKIGDYQDFRKYSQKLGFADARTMGAREAAQVVQWSMESNPNPELVKPAINSLLNGRQAIADYAVAKAKAQDEYQARTGGTLAGFQSEWQKAVPNPAVFLLKYQSPAEQAKLISTMNAGQKAELRESIKKLTGAGYLK